MRERSTQLDIHGRYPLPELVRVQRWSGLHPPYSHEATVPVDVPQLNLSASIYVLGWIDTRERGIGMVRFRRLDCDKEDA